MRILVTGASGFIGSRLIARLAADHEIWALYHSRCGKSLPRVQWVKHDFALGLKPKGLPVRMDAVIHLAQSGHYREFPEHADDIFAVGAGSTAILLEWARQAGVQRFILASTGGLYGWSDEAVSETDSVVEDSGPLGYYFTVKRTSELLVARYTDIFNATVLRFFFVYGSGQPNRMLIPRLVDAVRDGRPITLQGEHGMRMNPIHVSDAVDAIDRCLGLNGSHLLNIAGPTVLSLRRIGELIGQQVGHLPVFTTDTTAPPRHLVGDISRMSALLRAPTTDPAQGLAELCSDYKDQRSLMAPSGSQS